MRHTLSNCTVVYPWKKRRDSPKIRAFQGLVLTISARSGGRQGAGARVGPASGSAAAVEAVGALVAVLQATLGNAQAQKLCSQTRVVDSRSGVCGVCIFVLLGIPADWNPAAVSGIDMRF